MKKNDIFFHSLSFLTLKYDFFFGHFRFPEMIKTPTKPQFQPLSMLSKKVWANILSGAAVMKRPDFIIEKENSSLEIYDIFCPLYLILKDTFCSFYTNHDPAKQNFK